MKKVEIVEPSKSYWKEVSRIMRFEADGNNTWVFFSDFTKKLSTRALRYYHNLLNEKEFYRIHDKHLINVDFVEVQTKGKNNTVILSCKTTLPISYRRKAGYNRFMKKRQNT
jgi:two-component system LytT family response regulator